MNEKKQINNYPPQEVILRRIVWIDWAKTIGIFLVVLGHMRVLIGKQFIYMFHMAFFFMLSGYLLKHNSPYKEFRRSAKSLLLPYACFNCILLLLAYVVGDFETSMIPQIMLCNYELFPVRYFNPLWFLISLFIMRMICSFVCEEQLKYIAFISLLISMVLFYTRNLPLDNESDYFQWATTCICLPSYIMGYYVRHYNWLSIPDQIHSVKIRTTLILLLLFGFAVVGRLNGRVNVFTCAVGHDITIYYIVSSLLSFMILYAISKMMSAKNKFVEIISSGTILILAMHVVMIDGLCYDVQMNSLLSILVGIVIMVISIMLIMLSLRYFPFILGKSTK